MRVNSISKSSHRVFYEEFIGEIPKGMNVLHRCDNPSCVNPKHLFLGTQKENVNDMINKQRDNAAKGFHIRCNDCGLLIRRELWVPKNHKWKKHALCFSCLNNYDDPSLLWTNSPGGK